MCDFRELLDRYANGLPSRHLMFRVSKKCGYSQLVLMPRSPDLRVYHLLHTIHSEMGDYNVGKVYYYPKTLAEPTATYIDASYYANPTQKNQATQPLATFALREIPTAYRIEECQFAVYQLYIDVDCSPHCCQTTTTATATATTPATFVPIEPPPLVLPPPMHMSTEDDDEPTREELLSLLYNAPSPPCSSPLPNSPSPTNLPMPSSDMTDPSIVAIMSHTGYNQEDSVLVNKEYYKMI